MVCNERCRQLRRPYFFVGATYQCIVRIEAKAPDRANKITIATEYLRKRLALLVRIRSINQDYTPGKLGHREIQLRPLTSETGQHRPPFVLDRIDAKMAAKPTHP
jgi:hypothetical protein